MLMMQCEVVPLLNNLSFPPVVEGKLDFILAIISFSFSILSLSFFNLYIYVRIHVHVCRDADIVYRVLTVLSLALTLPTSADTPV